MAFTNVVTAVVLAATAAQQDTGNADRLSQLLSQPRATGEFLVAFSDTSAASHWQAKHNEIETKKLADPKIILLRTTDEIAMSLVAEQPELSLVPNLIGKLAGVQDPSAGAFSTGLDRIDQRGNLATTSSYYQWSTSGRGVTVYILDDEILTSHQDFLSLPGETRAVTNAWNSPTSAGAQTAHGTQMASIAAGIRSGVAKSANIKAVDVVGPTIVGPGLLLADVLDGLDWIELDAAAGSQRAIVNMSFTFPFTTILNDKADYLSTTYNIVMVAAAGNDSDDAANYSPASAKHALTVGTLNQLGSPLDTILPSSNYGSAVKLYAPGVSINAAWPSSATSYAAYPDGSSQAAAHVSGIAARTLESRSMATASATRAAIINNATSGAIAGPLPVGSPNLIAFSDFTSTRINAGFITTTTTNDAATTVDNRAGITISAGSSNGGTVFCSLVPFISRSGSSAFFSLYVNGINTSGWTLPNNVCATGLYSSVSGVRIGAGGYVYAVINRYSALTFTPVKQTYLYKFTLSGGVVWSQQIGANATTGAKLSIATHSGSDAIIVAGTTNDTIAGTTSIGGSDGFVVAFDSSGSQLWQHKFGSTSNDIITAAASDPLGTRIYAVGHTDGVVTGATSLTGTAVTANLGGLDVFVAEVNTTSIPSVSRTLQFGTSANDYGTAITYRSSPLGFVVAGNTLGTFAPSRLGGGAQDAFFVPVLASTFQQAVSPKQFGASGDENVTGVFSPTLTNDIFLSGHTDGSLSHGTNPGGVDLFVTKYSGSGDFLWEWQSLVIGDEISAALASNDQYSDGKAELNLVGRTTSTSWPVVGGLGGTEAFLVDLEAY